MHLQRLHTYFRIMCINAMRSMFANSFVACEELFIYVGREVGL